MSSITTNVEPIDDIQVDIIVEGTFCKGYRPTGESPGEPDHFEDIQIIWFDKMDIPGGYAWDETTEKAFLLFLNARAEYGMLEQELMEDYELSHE